ncbi:MAG: ATP diphosphatase, partial [Bacteroidia bacterium]
MYTLDDLRELMRCLRDPEHGCPWDLTQSYATIAPHTLEECFELVDAIESGDTQQMCQELGDVLFQVIFYSQLAEEAGDFLYADVVDGI